MTPFFFEIESARGMLCKKSPACPKQPAARYLPIRLIRGSTVNSFGYAILNLDDERKVCKITHFF
jgi:hypothetical protein